MILFLVRRTGLSIVILGIIAVLLFAMMHLIPGDPTAERDNGLQRRRLAGGDLQRIEPAPGNARHPDIAGRPRLAGEPGDDVLGIVLLQLGIFVGQDALRVSRAPDINPTTGKAMTRHVRVHLQIAEHRTIATTIGNKLKNRGNRLVGRVLGQPDRRRKPRAVPHRNELRIETDDLARECLDNNCHG